MALCETLEKLVSFFLSSLGSRFYLIRSYHDSNCKESALSLFRVKLIRSWDGQRLWVIPVWGGVVMMNFHYLN